MPKFDNIAALRTHLRKALDATQTQTIVRAQAELGSSAVSPIDTGRLRSSWFASEGTPSGEVALEGANAPCSDAEALRVDSTRTYYLTNSLPYAQSVALEGHVVAKPKNWFIDFAEVRMPKIQEAVSRDIKAKFDL